MKTIHGLAATILVALLATNSWATSNLNLSKSNINREFPNASIVTASVDLGASESAIVYTTPSKGDFILTQFCATTDAGILLQATGLGGIAQSGSASCITFTPGVSIPHNSSVACTSNSVAAAASTATKPSVTVASFFCSISGMQTTK